MLSNTLIGLRKMFTNIDPIESAFVSFDTTFSGIIAVIISPREYVSLNGSYYPKFQKSMQL